ncbi:MAG: N-acetylglucosamine-6-phosphate deacetylase [Microbacterium sp.]
MIIRSRRLVVGESTLLDGWVRIDGGTIAEIGEGEPGGAPGERIDLGARWVGPGFIDIHIHGAGRDDVMDGTPAGIATMAATLAASGVTSFVPTTYSAPVEDTLRALRAIQHVKDSGADGAVVLGAHMEGPFLSEARKGAHRPEHLAPPSPLALARYRAAADLRVVVIAPELAGSRALIDELVGDGIVVALGHTDADAAQMHDAAAAGAALVTHLFNGMPPLHHRAVGPVGAALTSPSLVCELIGDGIHVSAEAMRIARGMKGLSGIVLVSDAGRGASADGAGGATALADGTLASSLRLLPAGFVTFCRANGLDFASAWPTASGNAARLLGLSGKGSLHVGADADLTVLEEDGEAAGSIVGGRPHLVSA